MNLNAATVFPQCITIGIFVLIFVLFVLLAIMTGHDKINACYVELPKSKKEKKLGIKSDYLMG